MTNTFNTKKLVLASIFTALAVVVGYLEIVWPLSGWLKLDFSEVIILSAFLVLGFKQTAAVIVVRSMIRWLISGQNADLIPFFGEFMAITASFTIIGLFMLANHLIRFKEIPMIIKEDHSKLSMNQKMIRGFVVALGLTVVMTALNFFIATPIYISGGSHLFFTTLINDNNFAWIGTNVETYFWWTFNLYVPFNFVKGILIMIVFELLRDRIKEMDI